MNEYYEQALLAIMEGHDPETVVDIYLDEGWFGDKATKAGQAVKDFASKPGVTGSAKSALVNAALYGMYSGVPGIDTTAALISGGKSGSKAFKTSRKSGSGLLKSAWDGLSTQYMTGINKVVKLSPGEKKATPAILQVAPNFVSSSLSKGADSGSLLKAKLLKKKSEEPKNA